MTNTSSAAGASKQPILELDHVCKRFGGVTAADEVSFSLYPGEIFGLIGPNGSGKTTLINLITGIYKMDSGEISLEGRPIGRCSTHRRARLGVVRTFQHPRLMDRCDIHSNILLGDDLLYKRRRHGQAHHYEVKEVLAAAGLQNIDLTESIEKLSYGQQKLLEIVRALLSSPHVLLLDEPAAGLNAAEMEYIVALMRMATEQGTAVLLIEHAMDLVMSVCDRITVLNFGHQIAMGTPEEVQENPDVIEAYLGGNHYAED